MPLFLVLFGLMVVVIAGEIARYRRIHRWTPTQNQ